MISTSGDSHAYDNLRDDGTCFEAGDDGCFDLGHDEHNDGGNVDGDAVTSGDNAVYSDNEEDYDTKYQWSRN